jgi:hypothetical protein
MEISRYLFYYPYTTRRQYLEQLDIEEELQKKLRFGTWYRLPYKYQFLNDAPGVWFYLYSGKSILQDFGFTRDLVYTYYQVLRRFNVAVTVFDFDTTTNSRTLGPFVRPFVLPRLPQSLPTPQLPTPQLPTPQLPTPQTAQTAMKDINTSDIPDVPEGKTMSDLLEPNDKNDIINSIYASITDPITMSVMENPVINEYGQTYDRKSYEEHLKHKKKDPLSNKPLNIDKFYPSNILARQVIEAFTETKTKKKGANGGGKRTSRRPKARDVGAAVLRRHRSRRGHH